MTWVQTRFGRAVDLAEPEPATIAIEDIAYALARQARFNGHAKGVYSVAQHSVLVAEHCPTMLQLAGLLHDAAEAFVGDMTSPMKEVSPGLAHEFSLVEARVVAAIAGKFGVALRDFDAPAVKLADLQALATEKRDLMSECVRKWKPLPAPWHERILICWAPQVAESKFLELFETLTKVRYG
jgi:uncharacterized protein